MCQEIEATKVCFKCGECKPLSSFYKHRRMADGHLNKCKDCTKTDVKDRRRTNPAVQEYDRKRGSRQTLDYLKEYRAKYPKKYKAHNYVNNNIRSGKLVAPDCCEECGSGFALEGHHDDYDKPEQIRWLCALCHKRWHAEHGEALNPF